MADQTQGPVEYSAENPHGRQLTDAEVAAFHGGASVSVAGAPSSEGGGADYSGMKVADLRAAAKDAGITGAGKLKKADLVAQLNEKAQQDAANKAESSSSTPNKAMEPGNAGTKDESSPADAGGDVQPADSGGE